MPDPQAAEHWLTLASAGYYLSPMRVRRGADGRKRVTYFRDDDRDVGWGEMATTDPDTITGWLERYGDDVGFLIATQPSGLVVIDLDAKPDANGLAWWSSAGYGLPAMTVDTPSGGMHLYYRQDDAAPVANSAGAIAPGVDVRGVGATYGGLVHAPGTRVDNGEPGELYRLTAPLLPVTELEPLPPEVVDAIPEPRRYRSAHASADKGQGRRHDLEWIRATVRDLSEAAVGQSGGEFRYALMGASMMAGRLVVAGAVERERAEAELVKIPTRTYGAPDDDDLRWIAQGLDDGMSDPFTIVPPRDEPADPVDEPDEYARRWATELERERIRRDVRRHLDAEDVPDLQVLTAGAFLDSPPAEYLVPGVLYRSSTAKVYGPPGETKSFLALDLALSVATGRAWFGTATGPAVVHYVMAEGQSVNVGRTLAWLHHHGRSREDLDGRFVAIPQGVLLTPEGVERYLHQVRADQPALVVLDTKNAMMAGEENSATDVAVMVRAMRAIRDAAGGACVLLIDHTGISDTSRGRGSNAVTAAMDTEVRVSLDRATGLASAEVTRDKDAEPGEVFAYRLQSVTDVPGLEGRRRPPAVVVPAAGDDAIPFGERREWWLHQDPALVPDVVAELTGPGSDAARDIFRVLAFMDESAGVTSPVLMRACNQRPGAAYSEPTLRRGRVALERIGVVEAVSTGKYVLTGPYQGASEQV